MTDMELRKMVREWLNTHLGPRKEAPQIQIIVCPGGSMAIECAAPDLNHHVVRELAVALGKRGPTPWGACGIFLTDVEFVGEPCSFEPGVVLAVYLPTGASL